MKTRALCLLHRYSMIVSLKLLSFTLSSHQSVEDLATWVNFSSFHGKDWELRDIVAGYGCIDLFVEESKGAFAYMGPRLHRERDTNSTFFTWEYQVCLVLFVLIEGQF